MLTGEWDNRIIRTLKKCGFKWFEMKNVGTANNITIGTP